MRLMIVDDHNGARQMIREMLTFPGIIHCECASGEEAMEKAREFKPDWITMDVRMPGLNGFQAAAMLQQAHPATRIVIVTTDNHPHLRQMASVVGAVGFFRKENLIELRQLVADAIARRTQKAAATVAVHKRTLSADWNPSAEKSNEEKSEAVAIVFKKLKENPHVSPDISSSQIKNARKNGSAAHSVKNRVLHILMVEDNRDDCDLICFQLEKCGYIPRVERVFCEETMRAALRRDQWDIVFTDHGLPGFTGRAAVALLREMKIEIPVLCITGSVDPVIIRQILGAGANACISKDDLSLLCRTVERVLNGSSKNKSM